MCLTILCSWGGLFLFIRYISLCVFAAVVTFFHFLPHHPTIFLSVFLCFLAVMESSWLFFAVFLYLNICPIQYRRRALMYVTNVSPFNSFSISISTFSPLFFPCYIGSLYHSHYFPSKFQQTVLLFIKRYEYWYYSPWSLFLWIDTIIPLFYSSIYFGPKFLLLPKIFLCLIVHLQLL